MWTSDLIWLSVEAVMNVATTINDRSNKTTEKKNPIRLKYQQIIALKIISAEKKFGQILHKGTIFINVF